MSHVEDFALHIDQVSPELYNALIISKTILRCDKNQPFFRNSVFHNLI
jgi:hypothetical protein